MSEEFHYVRLPGEDGGVEVGDDQAFGLDLESVIADGLPPFRVALEIIAAMCEILDIADEDNESHGDIRPECVFIDETGAVSIEGYGTERRRTRAPEGSPRGAVSDLYGLGYTAFRLFSPYDMDELPDDDPDGHDDGVVDAVLTINLQGMPEEFHGDVQWYIAKLMSFDREDRPSALDAWRTFVAFADGCEGPTVDQWGALAVEGKGERRDPAQAKQTMAPPPEDDTDGEDLGGPVVQSGPLRKGVDFAGGGAAKGQATAFWSKEAMKAALGKVEEDTEEEEFRPAAGGGSATAFWSMDELQAMREGSANAPKPKRGQGQAKQRAAQPRQRQERPAGRQPPPKVPHGGHGEGPGMPPAPQPQPVPRATPVQGATPIQGPTHSPPPFPPPSYAEPDSGGGSTLLLAGIGGVLLLGVIVVAVIAVAVVGYLVVSGQNGTPTAPDPVPTHVVQPAPEPGGGEDTGRGGKAKAGKTDVAVPTPAPVAPAPRPKPRPTPKPTTVPAPTPRPAPAPTRPRPTPRPAAPAPAPTPDPAGGPARVSFRATGRGSLNCAGVNKDFDGMATVMIEEYRLPATCLITMDGKRGVFQVYGTGAINCNLTGDEVACDKMTVP